MEMSILRPRTCLICSFSKSISQTSPARRKFISSTAKIRQKSKDPSKAYTAEQLRVLERHLPAGQFAAIKAGEALIPSDSLQSKNVRQDPWRLKEVDEDNLAVLHHVYDKPIREPHTNTDPSLRLKDEEELNEDLINFLKDTPDLPGTDQARSGKAWENFDKNLRLTVGKEEAELKPRSALAPQLFYPGDVTMNGKQPKRKPGADSKRKFKQQSQDEEVSPALIRLMQMTGFTRQQILALRVKAIITHNVVNQTRLGKIRTIYYLSIAGNEKGLIGVGEGKSEEPTEARIQSQYRAIRNMQPILRYENRTIFGDVKGKVSATELELYARPPGRFMSSSLISLVLLWLIRLR